MFLYTKLLHITAFISKQLFVYSFCFSKCSFWYVDKYLRDFIINSSISEFVKQQIKKYLLQQ